MDEPISKSLRAKLDFLGIVLAANVGDEQRAEDTEGKRRASEAATKAVGALEGHPGVAAITVQLGQAKDTIHGGLQRDARHAIPLLEEVILQCIVWRSVADAHVVYLTAAAEASKAVQAVASHADAADIASLLDKVRADRLAAAAAEALAGRHPAAMVLLGKVAAECDALKLKADAFTARRLAGVTTTQAVSELEAHAGAAALTKELAQAKLLLAAALKNSDPEKGRAALEQVTALGVGWRKVADDHVLYVTEAAKAKGLLDTLASLPGAVPLVALVAELRTRLLDGAATEAGTKAYPAAMLLLGKVAAECATLTTHAVEAKAYLDALPTVTNLVTDLATHAESMTIAAERTAIADLLAAAALDATPVALKYGAAKLKLDGVTAEATRAKSIADSQGTYRVNRNIVDEEMYLLGRHVQRRRIAADIAAINSKFNAAAVEAQALNLGKANALLGTARTDCAAAREVADNYADGEVNFIRGVKALEALMRHQQKAVIAAEIATIKALKDKEGERAGKRMFRAAFQCSQLGLWACQSAMKIADASKRYEDDLKAKAPLVTTLDTEVGKAGATVQINAATAALAEARVQGADDKRNYDAALALLAGIPALVDAAKKAAADFALYETARVTAEQVVDTLGKHQHKLAIPRELAEVTELVRAAAALVPAKSADAKLLVDKVPALCVAATGLADAQGSFAAGEKAVAALTPEKIGEDHVAAVGAVRKLLDALDKHPQAVAIAKQRTAIGLALDSAAIKAGERDFPAVKALLDTAASDCTKANLVADQHGRWVVSDQLAKDGVAVVKAHAQKVFVQGDIATLETEIGEAKKKVDAAAYEDALTLLVKARTDGAVLLVLAGRHDAFTRAHTAATVLHTALGTHAQKLRITVQIGKIKDKLDEGTVTATARKHDEAMVLVKAAHDLCRVAHTEAEMFANVVPDKGTLEAILAQPGGGKALDALVAKLGASGRDAILTAALEARFGVQLVLLNTHRKSVGKLYDLLKSVPKSHGRTNPSLKRIDYDSSKKGTGSFDDSTKVVNLTCGRSGDGNLERLTRVNEIPTPDEDCKPVDDTPPARFDFVTLHEVGHAVDDRLGFMKGKAGDPKFAGWQDYGIDVAPAAAAAAAAFVYNVGYIEDYLAGGKPLTPPLPTGTTQLDWDARGVKVKAWCDAVMLPADGQGMWWNDAKSQASALNGVVHQEAYRGRWVSYNLAARKQGITGYQFRAPGEWLAELYAAYHVKKLKGSHPAVAWLKTL
ncbi:MAG: hypothetical protein V4850_24830 [Myxococcota bacterium]